MAIRKTQEQYESEVFAKVGEEFSVVSKYTGSKNKIRIKHNACGKIFIKEASNFLSIPKCPTCSMKATRLNSRKTNEEFLKEVKALVDNEYEFLEEYELNYKKIKCKHNICGYEWKVAPHAFLRGNRCPKCGKKRTAKKLSLTEEEFLKRFNEESNKEYTLLTPYINSQTRIKLKHNVCEHEYFALPATFAKVCKCPQCMRKYQGKRKKTHEEFIGEIKGLVGDEYTVISNYEKSNKYVTMQHNICNHIYNVTPNNFLVNNRRCPLCAGSHGERKIADFLDKNNISYEKEYELKDCRHKRPLKFDFVVFETDSSVNCLIEFDGEQHFRVVNYFGGEKGYARRKHKDKIKDDYCEDNNIKLIRIPYWDFGNIENILGEHLTSLL